MTENEKEGKKEENRLRVMGLGKGGRGRRENGVEGNCR